MMNYRVTASALNVRISPDPAARKLGAALKGAILSAIEPGSEVPGWVKLLWNGQPCFGAAAFLDPVTGTPDADVQRQAAIPAAPDFDDLPPAPPPSRRDSDLARLHPVFRNRIQATVAALNEEGLPFRIFEAYRTPERQNWLYAQGRTRPGGIVTKAQAWQSMHQYGVAADVVLFVNNQWSWGGKPSDWKRLHEVGNANGLHPLDFEAPHLELNGADWHSFLRGDLPPDGDSAWLDAVATGAARWRRDRGAPAGPNLLMPERPPLAEQDPGAEPTP